MENDTEQPITPPSLVDKLRKILAKWKEQEAQVDEEIRKLKAVDGMVENEHELTWRWQVVGKMSLHISEISAAISITESEERTERLRKETMQSVLKSEGRSSEFAE